jgi:hypothetical protein
MKGLDPHYIHAPVDCSFIYLKEKIGGESARIRYKDGDGDLCLMLDQEDLEYARGLGKGGLEVYL